MTALSRPYCSVNRAAPTFTLNCSSLRPARPNVNCELPPPVSKTARGPLPTCSPPVAARYASRASSSPGITSISIPVRARTASTSSSRFGAIRSPAVPTAAIAATSWRVASSAMLAMASTVRRIGSSASCPARVEPLAEPGDVGPVHQPSPTRRPRAARRHGTSPSWCPRRPPRSAGAPKPIIALSSRGRLTSPAPVQAELAHRCEHPIRSSNSTAIVRVAPCSVTMSDTSAMQPANV